MTTQTKRVIVLGLGNLLNRDEGMGVHALQALSTQLAGSVGTAELLDGGTLGLSLLPLVEESSHLLILDAVNAGLLPGTVVELTKQQIPLLRGIKLSDHQVTFQEVLGLALVRGMLPEHIHLVGVQPADLSIGVELSPMVAAVIPDVMARCRRVLQAWQVI